MRKKIFGGAVERHNLLKEKMAESTKSVLPISLIVIALCLLLIPIESGLLLSFIIGTVMIIAGMGLFSIGVDLSMSMIGTSIGAKLTKTKKLSLIVIISFILGVIVTIAEPDLQVLATNVPSVDTSVLIITVSVGVGLFLVVGMLRILFAVPFKWLLLACYALIFVLASFSNRDFLSVAFDSGGVTTGPMTVPFIMALGIGVASIRSDKNAKSDSFGLVALCSVGPILSVLILGFIYPPDSSASSMIVNSFENSLELGYGYLSNFPHYMGEVAYALSPIVAFFLIFQFVSLKMAKRPVAKIMVGIIYTYLGLVLFLTGVNVGFSSLGYVLGEALVGNNFKWIIIPLAMIMGWFIIKAEPAVKLLTRQVSELSAGAISEKAMERTLSIGIAIAMGLAMLRVFTGISIMYFVLPGYIISLALAFVVSPTYTAIAFDAGGVASGPMTATFMLPFAMGVCTALGGDIMTDAFGLVAMVAMMPLITVQMMGAVSVIKNRKRSTEDTCVSCYADDETIELWEV